MNFIKYKEIENVNFYVLYGKIIHKGIIMYIFNIKKVVKDGTFSHLGASHEEAWT